MIKKHIWHGGIQSTQVDFRRVTATAYSNRTFQRSYISELYDAYKSIRIAKIFQNAMIWYFVQKKILLPALQVKALDKRNVIRRQRVFQFAQSAYAEVIMMLLGSLVHHFRERERQYGLSPKELANQRLNRFKSWFKTIMLMKKDLKN